MEARIAFIEFALDAETVFLFAELASQVLGFCTFFPLCDLVDFFSDLGVIIKVVSDTTSVDALNVGEVPSFSSFYYFLHDTFQIRAKDAFYFIVI